MKKKNVLAGAGAAFGVAVIIDFIAYLWREKKHEDHLRAMHSCNHHWVKNGRDGHICANKCGAFRSEPYDITGI